MYRLLHQKWKLLTVISVSALIVFGAWPVILKIAEATKTVKTVISSNISDGSRS